MINNNYSKDYKKGFHDGLTNKTILIVSKMIQLNYEKNIISKISGLTEEEISIIEDTLRLNQHNVDKIVEEIQIENHLK